MANIRKVPVLWNGLTGLPGFSVFYSDGATDAAAEIKAFFNAIKGQFPAPLGWTIPATGDTLDDATGTLTGSWSSANGGTITASTSGIYAAGTGGLVSWSTNSIVGGRRLKGRTFLAPLKSDQYDGAGQISAACLGVIVPALATVVASNKLVVWHRPAPLGGGGGSSAAVNGAQAMTRVTSLRSRRI